MKVLQINLHHSKAASANLLIHLAQGGADIVLIQEPWILENRICGIGTNDYKLISNTDSGRPRSSLDQTAVSLEIDGKTVWVVSSYMAHDHIGNPPPEILKQLVITAAERMTGVVIGADANAHHTIWGSSDINERGESLFDFILDYNLHICNTGVEPTFIIAGRKEVLDITLTVENTDLEIKD
ncbi:uncharacterized protein LOC119665983 [Teleopsis dalmanni]|uniref:uncharacterized protein LOC119665983 n=1 Tax=Teleopsis dalmanni TaxID=139649 RepID=UPI0018CDF3A5|nr:uncharacterized protein LOC119665983 [Teleopsis dalmanni]